MVLVRAERALQEHRPRAVVVIGDTNSTLGCALAAVKLRIPVVHVEAGLRADDALMPEEINRRVVDAISHVLCTPSARATRRVEAERPDAIIAQTGDVAYDSLLGQADRLPPPPVPDGAGDGRVLLRHRAPRRADRPPPGAARRAGGARLRSTARSCSPCTPAPGPPSLPRESSRASARGSPSSRRSAISRAWRSPAPPRWSSPIPADSSGRPTGWGHRASLCDGRRNGSKRSRKVPTSPSTPPAARPSWAGRWVSTAGAGATAPAGPRTAYGAGRCRRADRRGARTVGALSARRSRLPALRRPGDEGQAQGARRTRRLGRGRGARPLVAARPRRRAADHLRRRRRRTHRADPRPGRHRARRQSRPGAGARCAGSSSTSSPSWSRSRRSPGPAPPRPPPRWPAVCESPTSSLPGRASPPRTARSAGSAARACSAGQGIARRHQRAGRQAGEPAPPVARPPGHPPGRRVAAAPDGRGRRPDRARDRILRAAASPRRDSISCSAPA